MNQKIKNQLVMNMGCIVSEQVSTMPAFRCWIAFRAIPTADIDIHTDTGRRWEGVVRERIPPGVDRIFSVRKVFAKSECIANNWAIGPDDEIIEAAEFFYSFEAAEASLHEAGVNTDTFIEMWNSEYPF